MSANILVFGDSIVWGAWDDEGGWAQRLKSFLLNSVVNSNFSNDCNVHVLGIPGDTSKGVLRRIVNESNARINPDYETVIIVAIGINDSQIDLSNSSNKIPPKEYEENMQAIIDEINKLNAKPIILGITPVDERVGEMSWKKGYGYTNEQVEKYNGIARKIASKNSVEFVDAYSQFKNTQGDLLLDGLHPNSKGHELIFEKVKSSLAFAQNYRIIEL